MPRYVQVADVLRQRIARGLWPQGHRLPSLDELGGEFGVARVTVRQAVELLAREGLLAPQQGRGTFVSGQPPNPHWIRVVTSLDDLARMYRDTDPQIVNIDESTTAPALRPDEGTPAERYVFMRRVHSREGRPYCVINIHLDEQVFRRDPRRFRDQTVIPLLATMKGLTIARAHQVLTIGTADLDVAHHLGIPANSPVAEVRRVFRDETDRVIYLGEVTYRGDAIHLEMNLKP
ncbi:MAG: GntR family transcriptional regulator [Proteobacteria bacterium]|nr:GntR family transcriptional regulator [Pseudomonadota bacterium]